MYCNTCDHEYDDNDILEQTSHDTLHRRFEAACAELGYKPRGANARDGLQRKALTLLQSPDLGSQIRGSMLLIRRHYDRSLHAAILGGYHSHHPDFDSYISMVFDSFHQIPAVIKATFLEEYGQQRGEIAPGYSHWYLKNSDERKNQFLEYQLYDTKRNSEQVRKVSLLETKKRLLRKHL
jgi:hypothetical protein